MRYIMAAVVAVLLLSGCTEAANDKGTPTVDSNAMNSPTAKQEGKNCNNKADIDYASVLKFNGITYSQNYRSDINNLVKGSNIGKIQYRMSGNACLGYIMQDGDATLLREGTELYEVKGYASSARLWAGDFLYEATDNPKAKTINDLLDIAGKIKTVRFVNGNDGITHLKDFTPEAAARFAEEYPKLAYVPFNKMYKESKGLAGGDYWIQIELMDGSTMETIYRFKYAAFTPAGYATPELASLVEEQRKRVYAK
ncbi:hypothetical protein [Paenibacillus wynnii]|uniref:hypothetical protein n=1 Tax=Paenibacillus wynnii TaxID=268407 RepID=UPI00279270F3|nr:hypothetical protein [Paenibacillus wynnii]MDQ0196467.1 hypothetical protein [Paenibacillus wynnii]